MLAAMLRPTCSRVARAWPAPTRRSNSGQSTSSRFGSRPHHAAAPCASPRSVIACSATTWKLAPIAAGRVRAGLGRRAAERALERLRDVVSVDVVQDAEAEVGQRERLAGGQPVPDTGVAVAGG